MRFLDTPSQPRTLPYGPETLLHDLEHSYAISNFLYDLKPNTCIFL